MLGGAVATQPAQAEQAGRRGDRHHPALPGQRRLQQHRHGGGGQVTHPTHIDFELHVPLVVAGLPERRPALHDTGHGHHRVQLTEFLDGRAHGLVHVGPATHVTDHGADLVPVACAESFQVLGCGQGVVEGRVIGADIDRHHPPVAGHQPVDRGRADAASCSRDHGHPRHAPLPVDGHRRATASAS
jgi:hypothetical protein